MNALGGTRRSALVALFAVMVMFVGATGAYAGGRDYGSAPGHQKSSSDDGKSKGSQESDADDESDLGGSNGQNGDENGRDCKKNEGQPSEQTGEQGQPKSPPAAENGGQVQGGQQGEEGKKGHEGEQGKEEHNKGKEEHNKGKENQGETQPVTPTSPTTVPTQTQAQTPAQTPAATTPVTTPVQTQQTPSQGGQVQGETQESPQGPSGKQGESTTGGRVLAENTTPVANQSQAGGLASTGFDAWLVALLGVGCIAGAGLLLRRTRRS
jgi:LPXTG-motif cell wall-anchored protein